MIDSGQRSLKALLAGIAEIYMGKYPQLYWVWEPMNERKRIVWFDWKPEIWRLNIDAAANPGSLARKIHHLLQRSNVLNHTIRVDDVKLVISILLHITTITCNNCQIYIVFYPEYFSNSLSKFRQNIVTFLRYFSGSIFQYT